MSFVDGIWHRLHVLLRGESYAREVERELQFHVELDTLSRENQDVEIAARRALGNTTYYREEVRRMTLLDWTDRIRQDLAYAWRGLRRAPGFATTVVVTLALGLGLNAAMYSFLDHVFLRPPAGVAAPREVRRIYGHDRTRFATGGGRFVSGSFPYPAYAAMRELIGDPQSFVAFTEPESVSVVEGTRRVPVRRSYVGAEYFKLLGVGAQHGRLFTKDEDQIEIPTPSAVISDALWHREFDASPSALGKTLLIRNVSHTIVGIAPRDFAGVSLDRADLWLPLNTFPGTPRNGRPWYTGRGNYFSLIARIPNDAAEVRLRSIAAAGYRRGIEQAYNRVDSTSQLETGPLAQARGPAPRRQELSVSTRLAGVAILVLIIACANVANLLIVRAMQRRREISVRRALGVSNARLYSQLLTESLLLTAIAGGLAIVLSWWGATALRRMLLPNIHWAAGATDTSVVLFIGAVALVVGVVAGLAPAVHAVKPDLIAALRAGSREGAYQRSWLRSALITAQAALSIVLVVGAALFVRSLKNVQSIDIGYEPTQLVYGRPDFQDANRLGEPDVRAAVTRAAQRMRAYPGVEAVAVAGAAPMAGNSGFRIFLPGRPLPRQFGLLDYPSGNAVTPEFFSTVGLRLLSGRVFDASDDGFVAPNIPRSIVASAALAAAFWPGESAVGKCVVFNVETNPCTTIVGVVEDGRQWTIIEAPPLFYYYPANQLGETTVLVRSRPGSAARVKDELRRVLTAETPTATYIGVARMTDHLEPQMRPWRLGANLFVAMSALALVVAAIGIYSVVAHAVSQRTAEMGIRVALGARVSDILDLVVRDGFRPIGLGIVLGIGISLALGRFISSLLFGVTTYDFSALLLAASLLSLLALIASLVPGLRAARVHPASALRAE